MKLLENRTTTDFDEIYDYCMSNRLLSRSNVYLSIEEILKGIHQHGYDVGWNDGYDEGGKDGYDEGYADCQYDTEVE